MFHPYQKEVSFAGKTLVLETGVLARQALGSVKATYEGATVLATVCIAQEDTAAQGFFPLSVHYQEKFYASGRIPGGFLKREGRASESEVLISRLIDRPLRPLFDSNFRRETQVICTLIDYAEGANVDVLAMIAASAAVSLAGLPFQGPMAAAKVSLTNEGFVVNAGSTDPAEDSRLNLLLAGTEQGLLMVESEAHELTEDQMLKALEVGFESFQPVIHAIHEFALEAGKTFSVELPSLQPLEDLLAWAKAGYADQVSKALAIQEKQARRQALADVKNILIDAWRSEYSQEDSDSDSLIKEVFERLELDVLRETMKTTRQRIDGRGFSDIRPIDCQTSYLKNTHGSALFTRGETQALAVVTLGSGQDEQILDEVSGDRRENFMLHYNFPPFSVGEVKRLGPPGRREVGHGRLAWRALNSVLRSSVGDHFPYTIRLVSEILESNGSSSMATVCGASLALMDAGVPLRTPVAGIAMGLMKFEDEALVLSDILGDEDHLGDMDFKVAGTAQGITALQMDLKIDSISFDIMKEALAQAKVGRLHILGCMNQELAGARTEVASSAPRMETITIPVKKIGELIGPGGKNIKKIIEATEAKIDVADNGEVVIFANDSEKLNIALDWVKKLTVVVEEGQVYEGVVARVVDFGAFVDFLGKQSGLIHISKLAPGRVEKTTDVVNPGDKVLVRCLAVDEKTGKIRLALEKKL